MGSIIDRALDIINDHLKDQTSSFQVSSPIAAARSMARGGEVLQDEYPTHYLPNVGRQVMKKGGTPKKGFEGRVSKKKPPTGPTSWDQVPTINPDDLVGKKIFPIFADLTKTGDPFMGIDASQLEQGVPMRGGPGYPLIPENVKHGIAWAVEGKGRGTAKLGKDANYAVVMAMNPDTHKSNATFSRALIGNMQAYVRDGRLSPENLEQLNNLVREPGAQKELQSLREFPGFEHPEAIDFIDSLSFEARKKLSDVLGSPTGQKLGAPNVAKIIRETADPQYAGVDRSAGLFLMELHPDKGLSNLKEKGLPEHESYTYGVPGRIVGKFHHPVAAETLFKDYFDKKKTDTEASIIGAMQSKATDKQKKFDPEKLKQLNDMVRGLGEDENLNVLKDFPGFEHKGLNKFIGGLKDEERKSISGLLGSDEAQKIGAPKSNLRRAFDLEMPVGTITQEIADMLPRHPKDIQSSQAARLALNVLHDRWHTSDDSVKEGGVSAANFSQALKDSDASSTLTQYSQKELNDMTRSGKFKAFKLKDGEVYFGLKKGTDYKDEYGFEHPELTPNETALVSVVNNEPGAKGIGGAPVVLKAIEHGATALDAFAVPSQKHPEGFLPDFYSHFGFKELGRVPFDPKYVSDQQFADMKHHWTKNGWDESMGLPSLAIMKWTGTDDDRKDALRKHLEKSSASDRAGASPVDVFSAAGAPESGSPEIGGEGRLGGESLRGADRGAIRTNSAPRPSDRLSRTLTAVRGLTPTEAPHFGLTPEDVAQSQLTAQPPAKAYGGAINPIELRYDDLDDTARRLILWSYAAAPLVRPLSRAEGGAVDDPVNKALDIVGAGSPTSAVDTARNLTPMGFYSAAAEAASKIPQRAPIDQIINKITGQANVKKEELANANLKDAFAGQRSVDPKEVARHLQENVPQIGEKVYGGKQPVKYNPKPMLYHPEEFEDADEVHRIGPEGQPPHYIVKEGNDYHVYGPSGYHETYNSLSDATDHANNSINKIEHPLYKEYTIPGGKNYREVVMHLPEEKEAAAQKVTDFYDAMHKKYGENFISSLSPEEDIALYRLQAMADVAESKQPYKSSHWHGVSNPLAHLRMSDRDNGKTLHLEELQSDWGQEGRDEGFGTNKIPTAPYVTSTDQWVDLGLKRALVEAAKGGYDKLIWTPGEAHADRYDLSKHVKKIVYDPDDKTLSYMEHGQPFFETMEDIPGNVEPDEIKKHIGKEAAKRLLATEPHKLSGNHILEGLDLEVGGEGMEEFYDKLVPQRLNKLIAQHDPSAKVEKHSYPLSYKVGTGRTEDIDWHGNPVEEMANKKVQGHVLHITPKLRAAILKGLPAFKSGGDVGKSPIIDHAFKVLSKLPR